MSLDFIIGLFLIITSLVVLFLTTRLMIKIKNIFFLLPFFLMGVAYAIVPTFSLAGVPMNNSILPMNIVAIFSLIWMLIILRGRVNE